MAIRGAINRALGYIAKNQQPDGGFVSFSSLNGTPFSPERTYHTTFVPSLTLACLSDQPKAYPIRQKLSVWLMAQKNQNWSFNYWARGSEETQTMPYPDDLDDTFCTLAALKLHDPKLVDEVALAKMVKLLIAAESYTGGPYRTWLVASSNPSQWLDTDLAVNSNIAFFLSQIGSELPNLTTMMEQAIVTKTFRSPYYPTTYPIMYFIARAYHGSRQKDLAAHIRHLRQGTNWGTPLKTALAITSLIRLGLPRNLDQAVDYLLNSQQADGSWDGEAFCLDPSQEGRVYVHGAPVLTTAFVAEALHAHYTQSKKPRTRTKKNTPPGNKQKHQALALAAAKQLANIKPPLKNQFLDTLEKMMQNHEIIALPCRFTESLLNPPATKPDALLNLSLANLYGWTAYTIYDDFLDGQGKQSMLPIANAALRQSVANFKLALPDDQQFQAITANTFDRIDSANAWELANCRFKIKDGQIVIDKIPEYGDLNILAERSLGHALPPLGVLAMAHLPLNSREANCLQNAFKHYLIARQLNDDAHDWQADLAAGHISYAVALMLTNMNIKSGPKDLELLAKDMQQHFWKTNLNSICALITDHAAMARTMASDSHLLKEKNIITELCNSIDATITHTYKEQARANKFLQAYRSA